MKKVFLFCFNLSLIVVSAFSQTVYNSLDMNVQMPDVVQKTIVKEIQYPSSISYIETASQHYFAYHDGDVNPVATVNNCYNSTQYTPSNLSMNQTLVTSNTFTVQEGSVNVFQTYVGQPLNLVVELGCYE